jgi:hypothetical protein
VRLKAEIWVKAYLRRCAVEGVPAVVVKRGDADAGAIYIKLSTLDGRADLFAPAPAGLVERDDRQWCRIRDLADEETIDTFLAHEVSGDPDVWIVEVEDRARRHFLDDWLTML